MMMRVQAVPILFFALMMTLRAMATEQPPNVVLIISDDQGWGDYGFMDHEHIRTPHLDRLARESLVFTRGYVTSPLCRPSLASMATGLYPHQHGVTGNDVDGRNDRAALDVPVQQAFHRKPSLVRTLVNHGYMAHQSGKWWEGSWHDGGFTHGMTHGDPARGGRHGDDGLKIGRDGMQPIFDFTAQASREDKPFFIWYAPFLPHTPHNPPGRLLDKYRHADRPLAVAKYFAMCEWFDETVGQLLDDLEQKGLADNTIVVYVCDNGWAAAQTNADDPDQQQWSGFALRSKGSPFEMGIRTPIMIRRPGKIEPKRDEQSLVSSIDLMPTILAALDIDPPAGLPGINLLDERARTARHTIFGSMHSIHNMTVGKPDDTLQYRWCIDGDWKLMLRHNGSDTTQYRHVHQWDREPQRLYHLASDPHEANNLAERRPEIALRLTEMIDAWHHAGNREKTQPPPPRTE